MGPSCRTLFLRSILGIHYQEGPGDWSLPKTGTMGWNNGTILGIPVNISDHSPYLQSNHPISQHTRRAFDLLGIHRTLRLDRLDGSSSAPIRPAPSRYTSLE